MADARLEVGRAAISRPALRRRAGAFVRSEAAPFAVVGAAAFALRVAHLAAKPFHHDESLHAWFSWLVATGQDYGYDPAYHGPVQFYLTTLVYWVLGIGDVSARLAPALVGTTVTVLPYLLRRRLGYPAALAASVLFCISPAYLYFSRFAREDIYAACVTLAMIVTAFAFLARPRPWQPSLLLGLLAVSFATKESTYITVAICAPFFVAAGLWQARQARAEGRPAREAPIVGAVRAVGRDAWIWGVCTFLAAYTLLFTTFFTNPHGLQDGLIESIRYWLSEHSVNRGGQPPFYYLVLLPAYEWLVLLLAVVGAVTVVRRPTLLGVFLLWDFLASLAIYSAAGERMPWLILHPLLPLVLLGGVGVQALWRARHYVCGRVALAVGLAAAVWSAQTAFALSYWRPANEKEMLVFTQTATDVKEVLARLQALDRASLARHGRPLNLEVDGWGGAGWPWAWYLRDLPAAYPNMAEQDFRPSGEALLVADSPDPPYERIGREYERRRFRLRVWWVVDYGGASLWDWARWFATRRTWGSRGRLYAWLYVRKDVAAGAASGARRSTSADRPSQGMPMIMKGRELSAWRTSANEKARESSIP
jgi:uncharacterized protein (TIGR03663 family)